MVRRLHQQFDFQTALRPYSRLTQRPRSSEPDENELRPSHIEWAIIKLFIVDLYKHIELKATLAKNFHIQPSEIDAMPYWEFELFIKSMNDQVKEENDRQQKEMDEYNVKEYMSNMSPGKVKGMMNPKFSPQMPNFGSMKTPSFRY